MKPVVFLQIASQQVNLPSEKQIEHWVKATLKGETPSRTVGVRIVDEKESQTLNERYRKKANPTNVLAFPCDIPSDWPVNNTSLGDLVVCAPVVENEAKEHQTDRFAHWAHITIHGVLHLLGYDHLHDEDAAKMEALESQIVTQLGYPDPYGESRND